jgi:hypothetical protein
MRRGGALEARTSPAAFPGLVLGGIGGVLLVIGSVMTWATVTLDLEGFARRFGVDVSLLQGLSELTSRSVAGTTNGGDGVYTMITGIAVLVLAGLVFVKAGSRKAFGVGMVVGGAIGGGIALYNVYLVGNAIDQVLSALGTPIEILGIDPGIFEQTLQVSTGVGIWLCVAGGALAAAGGIVTLMGGVRPAPAMPGSASGDMGFGNLMGPTPSAPPPMPTSVPPAEAPAEPPAGTPVEAPTGTPAVPPTEGPERTPGGGPTSS